MTEDGRAPLYEAAITVASWMAARKRGSLRAAVAPFVAAGVEAADLREAAYVAALFCGFPAGVAALGELEGIEAGAGSAPVASGVHHRAPAKATRAELRAAGEACFREIHRANAARQLEMLERLHPDFADTVLGEAYGRVLARPFLPLALRELLGVAVLSLLELWPQQRAHALAARNAGVSWEEIEAAVRLAARLGGDGDLGAEALRRIQECRERSPGSGTTP